VGREQQAGQAPFKRTPPTPCIQLPK